MLSRALVLLLVTASVAQAQIGNRQRQNVAAPAKNAPAIVAPPVTPNIKEQAQDLEQTIFGGWYTADVHLRYHHDQATKFEGWDLWAKIIGSSLAVIGFCIPMFIRGQKGWSPLIINSVGLTALLVGISLSYLPIGQWHEQNSHLADEWRSLAAKWKQLELDQSHLKPDEITKHVAELAAEQVKIEDASSKSYNKSALATAQEEANRSLGING